MSGPLDEAGIVVRAGLAWVRHGDGSWHSGEDETNAHVHVWAVDDGWAYSIGKNCIGRVVVGSRDDAMVAASDELSGQMQELRELFDEGAEGARIVAGAVINGPLVDVRVGPWVDADGCGFCLCSAIGIASKDPDVAYAYPSGAWEVYAAESEPCELGAGHSGGKAAAEACLRKLGAILPGDDVEANDASELAEALAEIDALNVQLDETEADRDRLQAANANLACRLQEQGDTDAEAQANDRKVAADLREANARLTAELEHMTTARDGASDYADEVQRELDAAITNLDAQTRGHGKTQNKLNRSRDIAKKMSRRVAELSGRLCDVYDALGVAEPERSAKP